MLQERILKDMVWVVKINYKNYINGELRFDMLHHLTILDALAKAHRHVQERWPYEIVSIELQEDRKIDNPLK